MSLWKAYDGDHDSGIADFARRVGGIDHAGPDDLGILATVDSLRGLAFPLLGINIGAKLMAGQSGNLFDLQNMVGGDTVPLIDSLSGQAECPGELASAARRLFRRLDRFP